MKGARAELSANTIKKASKTKRITIGTNHHFLRYLRNCQNSNNIENLLMGTFKPFLKLLVIAIFFKRQLLSVDPVTSGRIIFKFNI